MKYYREEPVGVVGRFTVVKTYSVIVYADDEGSLYDAIEEETIQEKDLIDISYDLTDVDSAGF